MVNTEWKVQIEVFDWVNVLGKMIRVLSFSKEGGGQLSVSSEGGFSNVTYCGKPLEMLCLQYIGPMHKRHKGRGTQI